MMLHAFHKNNFIKRLEIWAFEAQFVFLFFNKVQVKFKLITFFYKNSEAEIR